ncbi:MAG TPA: methyltransferase [Opitutaceae bacterium]|nr:methyltransferase [Opitutaceae bacterium]
MKIAWLLGWAVPETWFAPLASRFHPNATHLFLPPTPESLVRLVVEGPYDGVVGYSLGAHLLLGMASRVRFAERVALLAPFFAFPAEESLGGRVARTQLRYLGRWLRRDPARALADFYERAGLDVPAALAPVGGSPEIEWGLARLENDRTEPGLPAGWRAWCGEADPLLDARKLREIEPRIEIVPQAGHHPGPLIDAMLQAGLWGADPGGSAGPEQHRPTPVTLRAGATRIEPGRMLSANAPAEDPAPSAAAEVAVLERTAEMSPAAFDRAARSYLRHAGVQRAMAAWLAGWLPETRTGRAIEYGAGPGVLTEHLVPWNGELLATDKSAAMCAEGRRRLPEIAWRVADADDPAPGPWDWVFSSSMLQWAEDPGTTLAGWREQLAEGGRILAGTFVADTLPEMQAVAGPGPVRWRSAAEWEETIAGAGLRLLRAEADRRVFVYRSALDFWRSLHRVGAAADGRIEPSRLRRWMKDYDRRFVTAGGVTATWTFFRFEAVLA